MKRHFLFKNLLMNVERSRELTRLIICLLAFIGAMNVSLQAQTAEERPDELRELAYNEVYGKIFDKFVTLKLSPQCWERMLKGDGKDTMNRVAIAISEHGVLMGYGDLSNTGSGSTLDAEKVAVIFNKMNGKFSYTIEAPQATCSKAQWDVMSRFTYYISEFFSNSTVDGMGYGWRPSSGKMLVKAVFSPTAKDVSVAISPDKANFTVTVPSGEVDDTKWNGWQNKIVLGLKKGGAKVETD